MDTSSGRSTRRRWSHPSHNHPPRTPAKPLKRARKAACGRDACGEEDPEGRRVCSACSQAPTEKSNGPRWYHFQSQEQVDEAAAAWSEWLHASQSGSNDAKCTDVKEGFRPTRTDCLCWRVTCFFVQTANKWRRQVAAKANTRTCAVCERTKTSEWRHPSVNLHLFERYFTSSHATCPKLHQSGKSLDGESWLCNACFFDGYRNASKFFPADKSTVDGQGIV